MTTTTHTTITVPGREGFQAQIAVRPVKQTAKGRTTKWGLAVRIADAAGDPVNGDGYAPYDGLRSKTQVDARNAIKDPDEALVAFLLDLTDAAAAPPAEPSPRGEADGLAFAAIYPELTGGNDAPFSLHRDGCKDVDKEHARRGGTVDRFTAPSVDDALGRVIDEELISMGYGYDDVRVHACTAKPKRSPEGEAAKTSAAYLGGDKFSLPVKLSELDALDLDVAEAAANEKRSGKCGPGSDAATYADLRRAIKAERKAREEALETEEPPAPPSPEELEAASAKAAEERAAAEAARPVRERKPRADTSRWDHGGDAYTALVDVLREHAEDDAKTTAAGLAAKAEGASWKQLTAVGQAVNIRGWYGRVWAAFKATDAYRPRSK